MQLVDLLLARLEAAPAGPSSSSQGPGTSSRAVGAGIRRIVYVGDGRGDFCPCLRLLALDLPGVESIILARREYPDGTPCALWVMLETAARAPGAAAAGTAGTAGGRPAGAAGSHPEEGLPGGGGARRVASSSGSSGGGGRGNATMERQQQQQAGQAQPVQDRRSPGGHRVEGWATPAELLALLERYVAG